MRKPVEIRKGVFFRQQITKPNPKGEIIREYILFLTPKEKSKVIEDFLCGGSGVGLKFDINPMTIKVTSEYKDFTND